MLLCKKKRHKAKACKVSRLYKVYCVVLYYNVHSLLQCSCPHTSSLSLSKLPGDCKCWRLFWWLQPGAFLRSHIEKTNKKLYRKSSQFPLPPNWPASRMEVSVDLKSLAMKLAVQCSLPGPGLAGAYRVIIWYMIGVQGDHIIQAVCRMCVQGDVNRTGWLPGRHLVAGQEAAGAELLGAYCGHGAAELQPHTPHLPLPSALCPLARCGDGPGPTLELWLWLRTPDNWRRMAGCCRSWHRGNTTVMRENTPW